MLTKISFLLISTLIFLFSTQINSQNTSLPDKQIEIKNSNFENLSASSSVNNWQFNNSSTTSVDGSVSKSGSKSVLIDHSDWDNSEIISDPIELTIGHLYKLSAWIKTENAITDPADRYPTSVAACISMKSLQLK